MIQSTSIIIGEKVCRRKQYDFLNPNTAGITSAISIGSDSATIHDVFHSDRGLFGSVFFNDVFSRPCVQDSQDIS
jgi:hypothetical protein